MIGLFLLAALLAALAAAGYRTLRRYRRRKRMAALPGGSRDTAIAIEAFSDIDDHVAKRECRCGGLLASHGERSEPGGGRSGGTGGGPILRVVLVECRRCEERGEVWFDATLAYH
ncbi:MAG: hypothetical protein ABR587_00665 [Candidatus Binatia bacterium]